MFLFRVINFPSRGAKIAKFGPAVIQTASITSRATRGRPPSLPKAFPYNQKKFRWYNDLFTDTMIKVCEENAKIIVVEGPIGVGKSGFCKVLAQEFDMVHIPQPTMDEFYVLPSGYDLRQHDDELPDMIKSYDHTNFCLDPRSPKAARYQMLMLQLRFYQYVDAMCHLLNTGQGVVLERSYFSDYVFMKAMYEQKYISKAVADIYAEVKLQSSNIFYRPHLVIYLDIPVPVVQERIRTRNYSYEQNSPALTKEYLESLEKFWKKDYLREARKNSEVLIYDWTDGGDVDVVIDDIEALDFDTMRSDLRFKDWKRCRSLLFKKRYEFTNEPEALSKYLLYPYYKVDELFVPQIIQQKWDKLLQSIPECKYDIGYNPLMGDSIFSILFKTNMENYRDRKYFLTYNVDISD